MVNTLKRKPEVIICSEAWLLCKIFFINLPEYNIYNNESKINSANGVITFVKNNIKSEFAIEDVGKLLTANLFIELQNRKQLKITGIYRWHDHKTDEFIVDFEDFIKSNSNTPVHIVMGDVNLNMMDLNDESEKYFYNLLEHGYESLINSCTHPRRDLQEGSCLDHIFSKGEF